jgi:hypothetical protein
VSDPGCLTISDYDLRPSLQDWLHKLGNISAAILIVSVGVDNDVRARAQGIVQPASETARETNVRKVPQDMVDAQRFRDRCGTVCRTVVNYKIFDCIHTWYFARQVGNRLRQGLGLVERRYLDNELHLVAP